MPGLPGGPGGEAAGGGGAAGGIGGGATTSAVEETPPGSPQEPKPAEIIKSDPASAADDKNQNGTGIIKVLPTHCIAYKEVLYTRIVYNTHTSVPCVVYDGDTQKLHCIEYD